MNRKEVISGIFKLQANLNSGLKKVLSHPKYTKLQIKILLELDNQNGWVGLKDLSSKLIVSQTSITRVVERMQKQRLIHFKVPSNDRRKILIKPSPAGSQLLKNFYEVVDVFLKKIDKGLNNSEKKNFQVIFEKINLTDFFSDLE